MTRVSCTIGSVGCAADPMHPQSTNAASSCGCCSDALSVARLRRVARARWVVTQAGSSCVALWRCGRGTEKRHEGLKFFFSRSSDLRSQPPPPPSAASQPGPCAPSHFPAFEQRARRYRELVTPGLLRGEVGSCTALCDTLSTRRSLRATPPHGRPLRAAGRAPGGGGPRGCPALRAAAPPPARRRRAGCPGAARHLRLQRRPAGQPRACARAARTELPASGHLVGWLPVERATRQPALALVATVRAGTQSPVA